MRICHAPVKLILDPPNTLRFKLTAAIPVIICKLTVSESLSGYGCFCWRAEMWTDALSHLGYFVPFPSHPDLLSFIHLLLFLVY